jgi:Ca-activated chloride channel homolog
MDWESPRWLLAVVPALLLLLWIEQRSAHRMGAVRKRALLVVRALLVLLALLALAGPARVDRSGQRMLGFVLDGSQSMGEDGLRAVLAEYRRLNAALGGAALPYVVVAGAEPAIFAAETVLAPEAEWLVEWQREHGGQTDWAGAVELARGLFPSGVGRELMMIGDGQQTVGDVLASARQASARQERIHVLGVAGAAVADLRLTGLVPNRNRVREGATVELKLGIESALAADAVVKLFENGVEVERRTVSLAPAGRAEEVFVRSPGRRDVFTYRAVIESAAPDEVAGNNEALAVVDVRGQMRVLYVESDAVEGQYLQRAMKLEGILLEARQPGQLPAGLTELAGYDAILLSDVAAHRLGTEWMTAVREFVEKLGGGLIMLGGPQSFGAGGYLKSPLEEVLPVRLRAPDDEEKQSAAVALVLDRSGSMAGEKLEMAKSAAIATAEVLARSDHLGVYAFDSEVKVVTPMTRLTTTGGVVGQIGGLAAGGGTNLEPTFQVAREALRRVRAKVKHMIILTDGQTAGGGYETMAAACRAEGITISTVALGDGAHVGLLQAVAVAGGGQSYTSLTPEGIVRIFTQDTLMHTGRMLREEAFDARVNERHEMLKGLEEWEAPPLLGYVRTVRKASAQVPLVTDQGDPLLAHWRFGLGKVTAFTSDAKSRWGALWVTRWPDYTRFWSQVLRETARPAQGGRLDLTAVMEGESARIRVDLLADAETRRNDAVVEVEVFHLASQADGTALREPTKLRLGQTGPGLYEGRLMPKNAGVYLVRAQVGSETAAVGLVHQIATEASLGQVNEALLRQVVEVTGGQWLEAGQTPVLGAAVLPRYVELWPQLVALMLGLLLADLLVRRWEQVQGIWIGLRQRG